MIDGNNFHQSPIIGHHRSPLPQKFGVPRQSGLAPVPSAIELLPPFDNQNAFFGLQQFSHLWIIWQFHQRFSRTKQTNQPPQFAPRVRPPRLGGNKTLGVFATRAPNRPSGLGLSVVALDRIVTQNGKTTLHIVGADFVDGTPILDIKPYLPYADSITHAQSPMHAPALLPVLVHKNAAAKFAALPAGAQTLIKQLLAQDPRPAYAKTSAKPHTMRYNTWEIAFCAQDGALVITDVWAATA